MTNNKYDDRETAADIMNDNYMILDNASNGSHDGKYTIWKTRISILTLILIILWGTIENKVFHQYD